MPARIQLRLLMMLSVSMPALFWFTQLWRKALRIESLDPYKVALRYTSGAHLHLWARINTIDSDLLGSLAACHHARRLCRLIASSYEGFARVMLNIQYYIDTMNESIPEAVYKQCSPP